MTRRVGCERDQLPMVGQSGVLLPGKSIGILQRCAAIRKHIHRCCGTVLRSIARLYGIGLRWPGPSLQHSRVVARPLGTFQGIG